MDGESHDDDGWAEATNGKRRTIGVTDGIILQMLENNIWTCTKGQSSRGEMQAYALTRMSMGMARSTSHSRIDHQRFFSAGTLVGPWVASLGF